MTVHGFNHYNLRAPRELLDTLRDFYCSVVGLTEGERPPFMSFGYWLYAGGHDVLHLSEARPDEVRATQVLTTFDHVAFTCSGYSDMQAHLARHQIDFRLAEIPLTGQRQIFFRDPAGNGVELNFAIEEG
jgi:glyoxylase I family protein